MAKQFIEESVAPESSKEANRLTGTAKEIVSLSPGAGSLVFRKSTRQREGFPSSPCGHRANTCTTCLPLLLPVLVTTASKSMDSLLPTAFREKGRTIQHDKIPFFVFFAFTRYNRRTKFRQHPVGFIQKYGLCIYFSFVFHKQYYTLAGGFWRTKKGTDDNLSVSLCFDAPDLQA